jgi:C4-dicarboxylate-specific signal transduction histidine kinase
MAEAPETEQFNIAQVPLRDVNQALQHVRESANATVWEILNPDGSMPLPSGSTSRTCVKVRGNVGYYCCAAMRRRVL